MYWNQAREFPPLHPKFGLNKPLENEKRQTPAVRAFGEFLELGSKLLVPDPNSLLDLALPFLLFPVASKLLE